MTKQHFTLKEVFDFAWAKTQQHAWFLACTFMIYAVIMSAVKKEGFLGLLVAVLLALSLLSISLIIVRNENFDFSTLFERLRSPRLVINFLILLALYACAVFVFFIPFMAAVSVATTNIMLNLGADSMKLSGILIITAILLVPGIYIAVRYKFFPYVLLENEHMRLVDVIKHTSSLTKGHFWMILQFLISLAVINTFGALAFGVGLIITVPLSVLAMANYYRRLQGHTA